MAATKSWLARIEAWYVNARGSKYAAIVILCYAITWYTLDLITNFDPGLGTLNTTFSVEASVMTSVVGASVQATRDLLTYIAKLNERILANTEATRDAVVATRDMIAEMQARG